MLIRMMDRLGMWMGVEGEGLNWGGQDYSWGTFGHFELGLFPRDGEQLMQLD